ncbi:MAG TPA: carbamoyl-phosphate synthase domain-containing protein, partial [Acidimicrobiales bacterium]|nr:carbamoyl-phosphate synthase domain-containing protein [Acidimicrobiales bacterium]
MSPPRWRDGLLVLADGSVFEGEVLLPEPPGPPAGGAARDGAAREGASAVAAPGPATGEVVFNTVMAGYQEVLTDPSYAGQIISFTYPHIGNYGVAPDDDESRRPFCRGLVVRELTGRPSNWRAAEPLTTFLARHRLAAIAGVDTRRLTRHLRERGSMPGAFAPVDGEEGSFDEAALARAAAAEPRTEGRDLVAEVTCREPYWYGSGQFDVVAYDFGIKRNILRNLGRVAHV